MEAVSNLLIGLGVGMVLSAAVMSWSYQDRLESGALQAEICVQEE